MKRGVPWVGLAIWILAIVLLVPFLCDTISHAYGDLEWLLGP